MKQPKKRKRRGITARLLLLPLRERCAREQGQKKKKKRPTPSQKNQGSSNLKSLCCFSWMGFIAGHWKTDWERERERVEKVQSKSVTLRGGQSAPYAGKREREDPKEGDPNKAQSITKTHTQTTADNSRQTGQMTVEHKLQHCHHHHRHRNLVNLSLPLLL